MIRPLAVGVSFLRSDLPAAERGFVAWFGVLGVPRRGTGARRREYRFPPSNVAALVDEWRAGGRPVVFVRHDSDTPGSPLQAGKDGNALRQELTGEPDLLVSKQTNSAFYGEPDLHAWLQSRGLIGFAVCGVQTNHCVETTARMGGNLGYEVLFVADACHTFDRLDPSGELMTADELTRATVTSLHDEFATLVETQALLAPSRSPATAARAPGT